MKIKDIVNRDLVTLTNCDLEPIHIPGSIQPHGFLLAINRHSQQIDFCSANTESFIGMTSEQLLTKTVAEAFGNDINQQLKLHSTAVKETSIPLTLVFGEFLMECMISESGEHVLLEGEPKFPQLNQIVNVYAQTLQFVSYMSNTNNLRDLCALVAKGTREITGYDRVMIYRFDNEYNGEVFAESCAETLEPFLGLHYPNTDIPSQARDLYLKNHLRLIADIDYVPVPILTLDNGTVKNIDLSLSILRSTSPIHVEYLQNMGVGATLTVSLIHRGRLWGLIACHHYSPKNISPEMRLAAQLQGSFITSQIDVRQSNEEYEVARKTNIALEKLTAINLPPIAESFAIISINKELLKVCNAAGVSILVNGKIYKNGIAPTDSEILKLTDWLGTHTNEGNFHTDKVINFVNEFKQSCETVSGIIYHSLGNGNCIIWYRPETILEVNWGGDPNKAIIKDENGLHPRNSFKLWKEIIKCRSKEWLQPELNAAANYAHALETQIGMMNLSEEEEKYRLLSEVLKETNSELENINWISTHDLQEPLRKIQLISSRLLTKEDLAISDEVLDSLKRMNSSAARMQTLLLDILKYTRIKNSDASFEIVALNDIVAEVLIDLKDVILESHAVISVSELPVVSGVPFLLKQLFSNVILNSLKYAAEDKNPVVEISAENRPAGTGNSAHAYYIISLVDNGIGFDQQYADSIFNIFTRLHRHNAYSGSGVGLALCKKIMKTHEGTITATSITNLGTTIYLTFPSVTNE